MQNPWKLQSILSVWVKSAAIRVKNPKSVNSRRLKALVPENKRETLEFFDLISDSFKFVCQTVFKLPLFPPRLLWSGFRGPPARQKLTQTPQKRISLWRDASARSLCASLLSVRGCPNQALYTIQLSLAIKKGVAILTLGGRRVQEKRHALE